MTIEKKWMFWIIVTGGLALISVPSITLYTAAKKYFGFINSWNTGVIRPSRSHRIPPKRMYDASASSQLEVRFIKFSVRAPDAKSVKVAGDFNNWTPDALKLSKSKDGTWETVTPLPPGRYNYLYEIDGVMMIDPRNPETGYSRNRQTSVIQIK